MKAQITSTFYNGSWVEVRVVGRAFPIRKRDMVAISHASQRKGLIMERTAINIHSLKKEECQIISDAFKKQGWENPVNQYLDYWQDSEGGKRLVLVAEFREEFAGYLTILWESNYRPFAIEGIPEITDLNVLIAFQNRGIGTSLMDEAEKRIAKRSGKAGIAFGLTSDYGRAQILYAKRAYIPDGNGVYYRGERVENGEKLLVNDDLNLYAINKDLLK